MVEVFSQQQCQIQPTYISRTSVVERRAVEQMFSKRATRISRFGLQCNFLVISFTLELI